MIASLFKKSTPLNYSLVIIGVVFFFFLYQFSHDAALSTGAVLGEKLLLLLVVFASLFVTDFIIKRNGLSKDSSYTVLFYFLFLLFFPSAWDNLNLMLSNFFVLLAFRRLVSMQTPRAIKEKIFDASLWVFVAALFHFWSILFIILVFVAILFHAARDYRNWFLPFIALLAVSIMFVFGSLLFNENWIDGLFKDSMVNFKLDYFTSNSQNLALAIYGTVAISFLATLLLTLGNRPLITHASYKKIISAFVIGVGVWVISPIKSNDLLVFSFASLAMMATSFIEMSAWRWKKEVIVWGVLVLGVVLFFVGV